MRTQPWSSSFDWYKLEGHSSLLKCWALSALSLEVGTLWIFFQHMRLSCPRWLPLRAASVGAEEMEKGFFGKGRAASTEHQFKYDGRVFSVGTSPVCMLSLVSMPHPSLSRARPCCCLLLLIPGCWRLIFGKQIGRIWVYTCAPCSWL